MAGIDLRKEMANELQKVLLSAKAHLAKARQVRDSGLYENNQRSYELQLSIPQNSSVTRSKSIVRIGKGIEVPGYMLDGITLLADRLQVKLKKLFAYIKEAALYSSPKASPIRVLSSNKPGRFQVDQNTIQKKKREFERKIFGETQSEVNIVLTENLKHTTDLSPLQNDQTRNKPVLPLHFIRGPSASNGIEIIQGSEDTSPFISSLEQSKNRALHQFIDTAEEQLKGNNILVEHSQYIEGEYEEGIQKIVAIISERIKQNFIKAMLITDSVTPSQKCAAILIRRIVCRKIRGRLVICSQIENEREIKARILKTILQKIVNKRLQGSFWKIRNRQKMVKQNCGNLDKVQEKQKPKEAFSPMKAILATRRVICRRLKETFLELKQCSINF